MKQNRKRRVRYNWRISHQLAIAGGILLLPILIISSLYLTDRNREIAEIERQIEQASLIEPLYTLHKELSVHRHLLHIYLQNPSQQQQEHALLEKSAAQITHLTAQLHQYSLIDEQFSSQINRIDLLWQQFLMRWKAGDTITPEDALQQQIDLIKNVLTTFNQIDYQGRLFKELQGVLTQYIPVIAEDAALLHTLSAAYVARIATAPSQRSTLEEQEHQIHSYLSLTLRDFVNLRNTLERTFTDGLEREQAIPLLFELVHKIQEMEDMIRWDILDDGAFGGEVSNYTLSARELNHALFELATESNTLYQHRLYTEQEDQVSSRNGIISILGVLVLLAISLAATIVRHIVVSVQQSVKHITLLGQGDYEHPISQYEMSYNRSQEMSAMLRSIEQSRQKLQGAAQQTALAHQEVEAQKDFMKDLTDNMLNGVYALDDKGLVSFLNPKAEAILGYSREELVGKNIHQIIHSHLPDGTFVPTHACPVYKAIQDGQTYHIELDWFTRKDGTMIPVEFNTAPLIQNGQITGSVAVFKNISERLEMEQQLKESVTAAEEANQSKSDFLANMSHEIRTPMNAIIGVGYLALQSDLDDKQRGYITKIHHAAKSLLGIINDILDFSKVEAGKLQIENIPFSLSEVVGNTEQLLQDKRQEKGLSMPVTLEQGIPDQLIGDPARIGQIIINLMSNAIKFTDEGEVSLQVKAASSREDEHITLQFTVSDQGIGLSEQQQHSLFQPFTQADGSISRKYGGTGLGLSISKQLVELMGGTIQVESVLGEGSKFTFTLPLEIDQQHISVEGGQTTSQPPASQAVNQMGTEFTNMNGMRVLLVEDNEVNQMVATGLLELVGITVDAVENGKEALEHLQQTAATEYFPEVVLMDIQMPVMDGYEATHLIRSEERFRTLPIIAMTANAMVQDRQAAIQAGMNDHIAKPIEPQILYQALCEWSNRKQQDQHTPLTTHSEQKERSFADYPWKQIQFEQGVQQVGGREALFQKVIMRFLDTQKEIVTKIQHHLNHNELDSASRYAHSLKGMADTIGALPLFEQTKLLKEALDPPQDDVAIKQAMNRVETSLEAVLSEIRAALQIEQHEAADAEDIPLTNDETNQLQQLIELIENYDTEAMDALEEIVTSIRSKSIIQPLKQIQSALEQYDFDSAATLTNQLFDIIERTNE